MKLLIRCRFLQTPRFLDQRRYRYHFFNDAVMSKRTYLKLFCVLSLVTMMIYVSFISQRIPVTSSIRIHVIEVIAEYLKSFSVISKALNVSKTARDDFSDMIFASHSSGHYPRLSAHVYRENYTLLGNTSKLILLANGFFGVRSWGLDLESTSSKLSRIAHSFDFFTSICL